MIRVVLVDDHPVVRAGLVAVVNGAESGATKIQVVADVSSGEEAVQTCSELQPDVVLCDLRLGEGIDGIETTSQLRALEHAPEVLMLTTFDRDRDILGALQAGATGYLVKDAPPEDIVAAIGQAYKGQLVLAPELASRIASGLRQPAPELTRREREVLRLLETGATNRELARALFVTEATVKSHLVNIFTKLGVDTRARAVHVARARGLLTD